MIVDTALPAVLLLSGTALIVVSAVGLQRFDSVFARIHPATKAIVLGIALVLAGAALRMDTTGDVIKLLLVVVLQLLTAPIAAHMVARAAYRAGGDLNPDTVVDELAARGPRGRADPPRPHADDGAAE